MEVYENARAILERIEKAAGGREVTLVAASKFNGPGPIREAMRAGVRAFGENRAQELTEKDRLGAYEGAEKHFIGHLQKNKVKDVAGRVRLIQSVDSLALAEAIGKRAPGQEILLEVNIGAEPGKSGVLPEALDELAAAVGALGTVRVRGLMAIPPAGRPLGETIGTFTKIHNLFVDIRAKKYDNTDMTILSMGMTHDFEPAIREGSTMVRVGTGIFGQREGFMRT